jgi:hypothetical protein
MLALTLGTPEEQIVLKAMLFLTSGMAAGSDVHPWIEDTWHHYQAATFAHH